MSESSVASYRRLLSPGRIGSLTLRNRIVLTPMGTNLEAADGTPGERIAGFYEARARGGVGLVIVGVTGVAWPSGVSNPHNMGLSNDSLIPAFRDLTTRLHAAGARVAVQLQHAGKVSLQDVAAGRPLWVPSVIEESAGDLFAALSAEEAAAVTEPYRRGKLHYREMDEADIAQVCAWFAAAAERARAAGFDAIEIHAGHGYLLSSFLSPLTNRRTDGYGGAFENRTRFLVETIAAVRRSLGDDFPLWCRLDGAELRRPGGITEEDARRTAEVAIGAGLDAVHVSAYADPRSGIAFTDAPLPHRPCAYVEMAAAIKRRIDAPVIVAGRISPHDAEAVLRDGRADFIAMGRALIADPDLPRKLADAAPIRPCVYAYRCVGNVFLRRASECVVNPEAGHEYRRTTAAPSRLRRVLVVGGGPAGMETARLLAARGHAVTLCERESELGGAARLAAAVEPSNAPLVEYLRAEVGRAAIDVRLGTALSAELVAAVGADDIVLATGAGVVRPALPGMDSGCVVDLRDLGTDLVALRGRGERFAVLGGDLIGAEIAEWLAASGAAVVVLGEGRTLAPEMAPPRRWRALHALAEHAAAVHVGVTLRGIDGDVVHFADAQGTPRQCSVDIVVVAGGRVPRDVPATTLGAGTATLHRIGDCAAPGFFEDVFRGAAHLAGALS